MSRKLKFTLFLLSLIILVSQNQWMALAESAEFMQEKIYKQILVDTGLNESGLDMGTVFDSNEGQNLYLAAYRQQQISPIDDIIESMSEKYTYYNAKTQQLQTFSKSEIRDFLVNNRVDPSFSKDTLVGTQEALNNIRANFLNEVEIQGLRNRWMSLATMNEIFSDGDISNSGFDLVADLQVMDIILFKELFEETEVEGSNDNTNQASATEIIPIEKSDDTENQNQGIKRNKDNSSDSENSQEASAESQSSQSTLSENSQTNSEENFNPELCLADSDLQNTINEFEQANPDSSLADSDQNNGNYDDDNGDNEDTGAYEEPALNDKLNSAKDNFYDQTPALAKNWDEFLPCNKFFCLTIKFQNNDDEDDIKVYKKEDNCIACHINFIFENFYTLNSNSLVPGKVPGNFLEPNICKKAANDTTASMNITLVKNPIESPISDLILSDETIKDQLKEIYALPLSLFEQNEAPLTPEEQAKSGETNIMAKQEAQITEYNKLQEEIRPLSTGEASANIDDLLSQIERELELKYKLKLAQIQIQTSGQGFQDIEYQMAIMNTYFDSFLNLLSKLINGDESACQQLEDKETCS